MMTDDAFAAGFRAQADKDARDMLEFGTSADTFTVGDKCKIACTFDKAGQIKIEGDLSKITDQDLIILDMAHCGQFGVGGKVAPKSSKIQMVSLSKSKIMVFNTLPTDRKKWLANIHKFASES